MIEKRFRVDDFIKELVNKLCVKRMTENKRYKLHDNYNFGYAIEDTNNPKRMYIDNFECIVNELNNLSDENEQLKQFKEQVASVIEGKMGDNVCNNYKMEVLKEIWNELKLDEVWFE